MIPINAAANVSNLAWPYGCSASAGLEANHMPTSPMTFEAPSKSEWKPSASIAAEWLMMP